jgi:hypothetical protein
MSLPKTSKIAGASTFTIEFKISNEVLKMVRLAVYPENQAFCEMRISIQ